MKHLGYFVILSTLSSLFMNIPAWGTQTSVAQEHKELKRSPASLQQLAPKHKLAPSGAAQTLLEQRTTFAAKAEKVSALRIGPRVEFEQVRTMPQIGTLQPAFRYSDVTVKFR